MKPVQPVAVDNPIDRTRRGRQMLEFGGQKLANLIAIDAQLPVLQDLLLNIPVDPATFPRRAALLRHQGLLGATLPKPVIILEEGLSVGLMKPVEVGGKPKLGMPFLFDQLVFLDQEFPLPDIIAVEGFVVGIVSHGFASR